MADGSFFDEKQMLELGWPLDVVQAIRRVFEADTVILQEEIDNNTANIVINAGNIADNAVDIATNVTNISNNAANITTNTTNITTNSSNISINAGNITTNATNITTNATDIGTNATDISNLQSDKADKISPATLDNLVSQDASGNIKDSGIAASVITANASDIDDIETAYIKNLTLTDGETTVTYQDDVTATFLAQIQVAILRMASAQSVDSLTATSLNFDHDTINTGTFSHTNGTATVTINKTGLYRIRGAISINGTTANYRYGSRSSLLVNGSPLTNFIDSSYLRDTGGHNESAIIVDDVVSLTATDTLEIQVARISTTTGDGVTTVNGTTIELARIQ